MTCHKASSENNKISYELFKRIKVKGVCFHGKEFSFMIKEIGWKEKTKAQSIEMKCLSHKMNYVTQGKGYFMIHI
ncbi:CLUMA_CG020611, isoform A [Clunio marinus]|uniref:CLUMA_CG020611, isoform A n=1 Tax=Clunio marinus TaxID=568069 RepID=A0A1J1J795_9DIPT|nr:CLUMA_CG020611, isoform A [Clunio marinus]